MVIAGGGTGGHTSPGLAVAAQLAGRGIACGWIGSARGVEAQLAPARGIPYFPIPTGKLRRYWSWRNVADLAVNVPAGVLAARRLLRRLRPRVVFATGGYVALPVVLAAAASRVPVVIHEQTAVPGLANRIAARFARRVALTFPDDARRRGGTRWRWRLQHQDLREAVLAGRGHVGARCGNPCHEGDRCGRVHDVHTQALATSR